METDLIVTSNLPSYTPSDDLTPLQEAFCVHYVNCKNGTRAARLAGYSGTASTLAVTASENLRKTNVMSRIAELTVEINEATYMDAAKVLRNLSMLANYDARNLYDVNGNMLPPSEWDDATAFAITSIETEEIKVMGMTVGETKKAKFADKRAANVDLGKHFGVFEKDNKQKQTIIFNMDADDAAL